MVERAWTIGLSRRAENNIDQILLYISQTISLQQAQSFLREFYDKLENLKIFLKCIPNSLMWKIRKYAILYLRIIALSINYFNKII